MSGVTTRVFDGYELRRLLGQGGMGEVYVAYDTLLDREVAIKLIRFPERDPVACERFMIEARAVARIQHPNVVSVYRVGEIDQAPYLVSELVRGRSLDQLERPVDATLALKIAIDVASGLATAHRRGVVHRDIKPANAILSDEGSVKLLDFGVAKLLRSPAAEAPSTQMPSSSEPPAAVPSARDRVDAEEATRVEGSRPLPDPPPSTPAASLTTTAPQQGSRAPIPSEDLTRTGAAVGTPRYMAPEIWRGEQATFAADVYSFGALLFTLCANRPVHPARDAEELQRAVLTLAAPPLHPLAPHLDPRFCAVVDRCLRREPSERFASAGELRSELVKLMPGARRAVIPEGNPYRGLSAFGAEHRDLFFGRDSETRMLLERLVSDPFVLVAGDSGVGKSSLCRAGVVPRLDECLGLERRWTAVSLVPGAHPVASLAAAFAPLLGETQACLEEIIVSDAAGFARRLEAWSSAETGMLLLVDQLEELVTLADPAQAAAVSEVLGWLAVSIRGTRLMATVRGDFLSRVALLPRVGDQISRALFFLRPLTPERVRDTVLEPARAKGVTFEPESLVDELVDAAVEAGTGGLPLLQFALAELWQAREGQTISRHTLDTLGGVAGALGRHAEQVTAQLSPALRETVRKVLLELVSADGTRNRKTAAELDGADPSGKATAALVNGRLVVSCDTPDGPAYQLAHEALVGSWYSLAAWLGEGAERQRALERLRLACREWERSGRSGDALWSPRQLAELERIDLAPAPSERAFVLASRRRRRQRRLGKALALLSLPALLSGGYGAVRIQSTLEQNRKVDAALVQAHAESEQADRAGEAAARLRSEALRSFDEAKGTKGREAAEQLWRDYLAAAGAARVARLGASGRLESALLMDGTRSDTRAALADDLLAQALLAEQRYDEARVDELLQRLAVHDQDGSRQTRWKQPATLTLQTDPADAHVTVSRIQRDAADRARLEGELGGPFSGVQLAPGSYLATVDAPGRAPVRLPFLLRRGEAVDLAVALPAANEIPAGFVYVPPGRFGYGSDAPEQQRRDFFHAVPLHQVSSGGYLIAQHETTFGDWIHYLNALPEDDRADRIPEVGKGGFQGALRLSREGDSWVLSFQPTTVLYRVRAGEPVHYQGRSGSRPQDWLRWPVVGITAKQAEAYAAWMATSGRVPGARLCSEREWERAARGSDGRLFPHGWQLTPSDANHDETYGKVAEAMGPDEVGMHPASRSPFGIDDTAGNVWEWTRSRLSPTGYAARGGSWYFGPSSSRVDDREETESSFRDVSVGLRLCADRSSRGS